MFQVSRTEQKYSTLFYRRIQYRCSTCISITEERHNDTVFQTRAGQITDTVFYITTEQKKDIVFQLQQDTTQLQYLMLQQGGSHRESISENSTVVHTDIAFQITARWSIQVQYLKYSMGVHTDRLYYLRIQKGSAHRYSISKFSQVVQTYTVSQNTEEWCTQIQYLREQQGAEHRYSISENSRVLNTDTVSQNTAA